MSLVTIRVQNAVGGARVAGVSVRVYEVDGTPVTDGVTDGDGEAHFDLPDADYDLYFYKVGLSVTQPQRITVDALLSNIFRVDVHLYSLPEATDPTKCRISGYLLNAMAQPARGKLILSPAEELVVDHGRIIQPQDAVTLLSDDTGYFSFDLLRGATYFAYLANVPLLFGKDPKLNLIIPDLPALSLDDALFPVPMTGDFDPTSITLPRAGGADTSVKVEVSYSDGSIRGTPPPWGNVTAVNNHPEVCEAVVHCDRLAIQPLAVGVATITLERYLGAGLRRVPAPAAFVSGSLAVTIE